MRTIEHWIAGKATTGIGQRAPAACGTRPPASSRPRCCSPRATDVDAAVAAAREAFAELVAVVAEQAHQGAVRLPRAGQRQRRPDRRGDHRRARQGARPTRQGEVQRGLEVVEFACGIPQLLKGEFSAQVSTGVDLYSFREPLGVVRRHHAVQLPGHGADVDVPGGHRLRQHVRAQAERARPVRLPDPGRAVGARPGCPTASSTSLHGDKEAVDGLLEHPDVAAVSFVGSTPIAKYIHEPGDRQRQAGAGARRRQEPRDRPARTPTSTSPPTSSSRRPSARPASAAWRSRPPSTVGGVGDSLVEQVNAKARAVRVGSGRDADSEMGPVVTPEARDRIVGLDRHGRAARAPSSSVDGRGRHAWTATRTASSSAPRVIDQVTPDMDVYTRGDLRPGAVRAAHRTTSTPRSI